MRVSSLGFLIRPEDQLDDVGVDETIRELLDRAAADGVAPSELTFMSDVTALPDDQVRILDRRMKAAGLTVVLVDDRPPCDRRPGTIRSAALHPYELVILDQAAAARSVRERRPVG